MALLKLCRRVPGALEVTEVNMPGDPQYFWINKKIGARPDDDNQTPWRVFSIGETAEANTEPQLKAAGARR
jgi:hypothetical protein